MPEDAELLTDLAYTTFWDAFHKHPKNAPHDLEAYMQTAFRLSRYVSEIADPNSVFFIADIEGELAGYAKLIFESTEPDIVAEWPVELSRLYSHQKYLRSRALARP